MKRNIFSIRGLRSGIAALSFVMLTCTVANARVIKVNSDMMSGQPKVSALSRVDINKQIALVFVLNMRDAQGAADYARRVSTPADPLYRHFLTSEQFDEKFCISKNDYDNLVTWVKQKGLAVDGTHSDRCGLILRGTIGQFGDLLKTEFNNYLDSNSRQYYSAVAAPSLPEELAHHIQSIVGLSNYFRPRPGWSGGVKDRIMHQRLSAAGGQLSKATQVTQGTGPDGYYAPSDLRTAYNIPFNLSIPSKRETVALYEGCSYEQKNIDTFVGYFHLPNVSVTPILINGYDGKDLSGQDEVELDIEALIGMNPALKEVLVYEYGGDVSFAVSLIGSLQAIAKDNKANVVSISWVADEDLQGFPVLAAEATYFEKLAAQGIAVFASAGDQGAYGIMPNGPGGASSASYHVENPASQPFVTAVGGTTLKTGPGQIFDPVNNIGSETVWNFDAPYGTGGGVSAYWKIPSWQKPRGIFTPATNGGSLTMRNLPDVAADADPATSMAIYSQGYWRGIGGTSLSAPLWAGYISVIDAISQTFGLGRVGFINPMLYDLMSKQNHAAITNGVVYGNNGDSQMYPGLPGYKAGLGYNNCAGFGSMSGFAYAIEALSMPHSPGIVPSHPQGFQLISKTSTTVTVGWTANEANGYLVAVYGSVNPPNSSPNPVSFDATRGTRAVLRNLQPNTSYLVVLSAINAHGSSLANPSGMPNLIVTTSK